LFGRRYFTSFFQTSFGAKECGNEYQSSKQYRRPGSLFEVNNARAHKESAQYPAQYPAEPDNSFCFLAVGTVDSHALKIVVHNKIPKTHIYLVNNEFFVSIGIGFFTFVDIQQLRFQSV
jgi:hypothetical protein